MAGHLAQIRNMVTVLPRSNGDQTAMSIVAHRVTQDPDLQTTKDQEVEVQVTGIQGVVSDQGASALPWM